MDAAAEGLFVSHREPLVLLDLLSVRTERSGHCGTAGGGVADAEVSADLLFFVHSSVQPRSTQQLKTYHLPFAFFTGTMLMKEYRICMPLTVEEVGEVFLIFGEHS